MGKGIRTSLPHRSSASVNVATRRVPSELPSILAGPSTWMMPWPGWQGELRMGWDVGQGKMRG